MQSLLVDRFEIGSSSVENRGKQGELYLQGHEESLDRGPIETDENGVDWLRGRSMCNRARARAFQFSLYRVQRYDDQKRRGDRSERFVLLRGIFQPRRIDQRERISPTLFRSTDFHPKEVGQW